jgi:hypothetical protein
VERTFLSSARFTARARLRSIGFTADQQDMPEVVDEHLHSRAGKAFWLLAGVLAVIAAAKPIVIDTLDPDLFWHLLVARQLLHDGIGPLVDHISYCSIRQPWTPYSWLAELAMNGLWQWGGYRAALAAHATLTAGVILAVAGAAVECVPRSVSRAQSAALVATGAAMMLVLPWFGFRPAAFAICIVAIIVWILYRDRARGERSWLVWAVVPLTALLANIHLFSLASPLWVGALFCGALIERARSDEQRRAEATHRAVRYGTLTLLAAAACCATPMLAGFVRTAVYYQFSDPLVASTVIAEMQPFYLGIFGKIIVVMLAVVAVMLIVNRRTVRAGEWLMLAIGIGLLFQHGRFAPLFALTLAPVLCLTISDISDRRLAQPRASGLAAVALLGALIAFCAVFPSRGTPLEQWLNRRGPDHAGYPCAAARFVEQHVVPVHGRIVNEFTWGGYLAWRLNGHFQVLLDGRTQLYTPQFWRDAYLGDASAQRRLLQRADADAAILPVQGSVFRSSLDAAHWSVVYSDARAVVMAPPPAAISNPNPRAAARDRVILTTKTVYWPHRAG